MCSSPDPASDTAPLLAAFLSDFNAGFIGLAGTKAEVDFAQAQAQARVSLASPEPVSPGSNYLVDHAAQIIADTPDGLAHFAFFQGMPSAEGPRPAAPRQRRLVLTRGAFTSAHRAALLA